MRQDISCPRCGRHYVTRNRRDAWLGAYLCVPCQGEVCRLARERLEVQRERDLELAAANDGGLCDAS